MNCSLHACVCCRARLGSDYIRTSYHKSLTDRLIAVILHPGEPERQLEAAHRIYHAICQWRMAPHMAFLIQDDFAACIERALRRIAHTFAPNELALLREIETLYDRYALRYQQRIICLDRRHMEVDDMVQTIRNAVIAHGM